MCPIWPFHWLFLYLLILGPLWLASCAAASYAVKYIPVGFDPNKINVRLEETKEIYVFSEDPEMFKHNWTLYSGEEQNNVRFDNTSYLLNINNYSNWTSAFNITGNFLGKTHVKLRAVDEDGSVYESKNALSVITILGKRKLDRIFTASVIVMITIVYIMFGSALDWPLVKETIRKPIAPTIGFVSQFIFMPLMSFALGKLLFPCTATLRLGLFLTGLSPGGGASNIWSAAMNANVNLSITMTTISIIAAFGMIPLWLFTLGEQIAEEAHLSTPSSHIAYYLVSLLVPVGVGFAIQHFYPRVGKILNRLLKPLSIFLIIFIVIFACVTKFYLFRLFTRKVTFLWIKFLVFPRLLEIGLYDILCFHNLASVVFVLLLPVTQVVVAGLALPWLGYCAGFLAAWALRQPLENILAISIETGVQNTGIAIFMAQLVLDQPDADLSTVIPVAVAVMAPIPLTLLSLILKLRTWKKKKVPFESHIPGKEILT